MKITASQQRLARDIEDGSVVEDENGVRVLVDEVSKKAGQVILYVVAETVHTATDEKKVRRRTIEHAADDKVTVYAGADVGRYVTLALLELMTDDASKRAEDAPLVHRTDAGAVITTVTGAGEDEWLVTITP